MFVTKSHFLNLVVLAATGYSLSLRPRDSAIPSGLHVDPESGLYTKFWLDISWYPSPLRFLVDDYSNGHTGDCTAIQSADGSSSRFPCDPPTFQISIGNVTPEVGGKLDWIISHTVQNSTGSVFLKTVNGTFQYPEPSREITALGFRPNVTISPAPAGWEGDLEDGSFRQKPDDELPESTSSGLGHSGHH